MVARTDTGIQMRPMGDSIACGLGAADCDARVSAHPAEVLEKILTAIQNDPDAVRGKVVPLSSGASNSWDPGKIRAQIKALKDAGAKDVALLGVGTRPDIVGRNDELRKIADEFGITFVPLTKTGADQVHPSNYADLRERVNGYVGYHAEHKQNPAAQTQNTSSSWMDTARSAYNFIIHPWDSTVEWAEGKAKDALHKGEEKLGEAIGPEGRQIAAALGMGALVGAKAKDKAQSGDADPDDENKGKSGFLGNIFGSLMESLISNPLMLLLIGLVVATVSLFTGQSMSGMFSFLKPMLGMGEDGSAESMIGERTKQAGKAALTEIAHGNILSGASKVYHAGADAVGDLSKANKAVEFLVNECHWDKMHASAAVANMYKESGLNPHVNPGDGGKAVGMVQWWPDRQKAILVATGIDVRNASFEDNLRALDYEVKHGNERVNGDKFFRTTTVAEAGQAFSNYIERPDDKDGQKALARGKLAEKIYLSAGGQFPVDSVHGIPATATNTPTPAHAETPIRQG